MSQVHGLGALQVGIAGHRPVQVLPPGRGQYHGHQARSPPGRRPRARGYTSPCRSPPGRCASALCNRPSAGRDLAQPPLNRRRFQYPGRADHPRGPSPAARRPRRVHTRRRARRGLRRPDRRRPTKPPRDRRMGGDVHTRHLQDEQKRLLAQPDPGLSETERQLLQGAIEDAERDMPLAIDLGLYGRLDAEQIRAIREPWSHPRSSTHDTPAAPHAWLTCSHSTSSTRSTDPSPTGSDRRTLGGLWPP